MKKEELRKMIREELKSVLQEGKQWWLNPSESEKNPHLEPDQVHEKSVPQPYNRKSARPMSKSQVERRKKIGQSMMDNEKLVSSFRKKHGDEWKDYLWRAATAATFKEK